MTRMGIPMSTQKETSVVFVVLVCGVGVTEIFVGNDRRDLWFCCFVGD